mgnify:CR=1 FL=1
MKRFLPLLIMFALALPAVARRTKSGPGRLSREAVAAEAVYDTIVPAAGLIRCSGYDKPNRATRETFFLTNTDSLDVDAVNLTLDYFDSKGRQLHSATHTVRLTIPAGATRSVSVRSWDRNNAFHYVRSGAPKRRASTPFSVKARVNYLLRLRIAE